jgi:hypothetical protein
LCPLGPKRRNDLVKSTRHDRRSLTRRRRHDARFSTAIYAKSSILEHRRFGPLTRLDSLDRLIVICGNFPLDLDLFFSISPGASSVCSEWELRPFRGGDPASFLLFEFRICPPLGIKLAPASPGRQVALLSQPLVALGESTVNGTRTGTSAQRQKRRFFDTTIDQRGRAIPQDRIPAAMSRI